MGLAQLPFGLTFRQLHVGQLYVKCPDIGADLRYAANIADVFGDITTARLQTGDIRCLFEDFHRYRGCVLKRTAREDIAGTAMRCAFRPLRHMTARQSLLDIGLAVHREPVSRATSPWMPGNAG